MNFVSNKLTSRVFWTIVVAVSGYYLYVAILFRINAGLGPSMWNRQFWFIGHIIPAVISLMLGPVQFSAFLRATNPKLHRFFGKIYIICSLIAGIFACYLSMTSEVKAIIIPLVIQSVLWIFMTLAAWLTIRKMNIAAHRLFTIRSYVLALTFVFIRILGGVSNTFLFSGIKSVEERTITLQWLSWTVPLLLVELIFLWVPSIKYGNVSSENR
jgi:uncharacterized membrane protein